MELCAPAWMGDVPVLPAMSAGMSDAHCQAHGEEELPGEEPGSCGEAKKHFDLGLR